MLSAGRNGRVAHSEHFPSSFQQAFMLPGPVDGAKIHSELQGGVLTVAIPTAS